MEELTKYELKIIALAMNTLSRQYKETLKAYEKGENPLYISADDIKLLPETIEDVEKTSEKVKLLIESAS